MQQDEQGFYDIYGTRHIPFWKTQIFFMSIVTCAIMSLLIFLYIFYLYWRRRSQKSLPTRIRVMQELHNLQQRLQLPHDKHDTVHAYAQLGFLLREFLADLQNNPSLLSYTEPDLLHYISTQEMLPETIQDKNAWYALFADLFARMSGAKYAKAYDERKLACHDVGLVIEYLKSYDIARNEKN